MKTWLALVEIGIYLAIGAIFSYAFDRYMWRRYGEGCKNILGDEGESFILAILAVAWPIAIPGVILFLLGKAVVDYLFR